MSSNKTKTRATRRERRKAKQSGYRRVAKGNKVGHGGCDSHALLEPRIKPKEVLS